MPTDRQVIEGAYQAFAKGDVPYTDTAQFRASVA
jgi:hypothetical protein